MDFSIKAFNTKNAIAEHKTGCVVVGVYENSKLSAQAKLLDSKGVVSTALKTGDITGKPGSTLLLHAAAGQAKRVLLVGLGPEAGMSDRNFISVAQAVARVLSSLGAADALVALPIDLIQGRDVQWGIRSLVLALRESVYRSDGLKSKKDDATNGVKRVVIGVDGSLQSQARTTLLQSVAMANGLDLSKTLGNLPPNICTPTYLANTAKQLAKEYKLNVEVLDRKQLEALKMGSFLSVTQGSEQPPKFIVLKHMGGKAKDAPVVLVGKGITFDTGGISLKPGSGMDEMKYDMCGAGSVLGTFRAIAEMQLKLNVIGVIPTCENMPSGRATRPGDIVTSMSGQTVEILNTDAEGRLILCDALTYVEKFKPASVVDIATLTGACVIALGAVNTGLFTADDGLADALSKAGQEALDTAWRMPLQEEYQELLKSPFADMANVGGRAAGSVSAACFLWRFTKAYRWAHLDIAGTAWKSGAAKGATGRPVSLLVEFLKNGLE